MADAESRKERFQGQGYEREDDAALHQRYLKLKQERDVDKSRENADRVNLEDAVDIVGTCDMMCPEFESLQRYFERDLDPFEKSPSGGYDRRLMVQTFARAAAGNDLPPSEDIRPPPMLRITINYLLDHIMVEHGIEATHNFIWGRTRAVRSDLTRQRDHSPDSIYCLERIVRYHILAFHNVCRGRREIETLEIEQLKKALQSLMEVYHDARSKYTSANEAEFRSYYMLMHIRSRHAPFTLRGIPPVIYNSPILQWALRIRFTLTRNSDGADEHGSDVTQMDYSGFFSLVLDPSTSYLTACLLESHFDDTRRQMCLMMGLSLKATSRIVTLPQFQALLYLDSIEDAVGWLAHLKWNLTNEGLVEIPQSRKFDALLPSIATATAFPRNKSALVASKKVVAGLPPHVAGGRLDSLITQEGGSKFGRDFQESPANPRQRRSFASRPAGNFQGVPVTRPAFSSPSPAFPAMLMAPKAASPQPPPPAPPSVIPTASLAPVQSAFNPFGARKPSPSPQSQTQQLAPALGSGTSSWPVAVSSSAFSATAFPSQPPSTSPFTSPSQTLAVAASVEPTASSSNQTAFTPNPTTTAPKPAAFTSNPPTFSSNPSAFTPNPTTFAPNPTTFAPNPTPFTLNPAAATFSPATFTTNPTTFASKPAPFTTNPTAFTSSSPFTTAPAPAAFSITSNPFMAGTAVNPTQPQPSMTVTPAAPLPLSPSPPQALPQMPSTPPQIPTISITTATPLPHAPAQTPSASPSPKTSPTRAVPVAKRPSLPALGLVAEGSIKVPPPLAPATEPSSFGHSFSAGDYETEDGVVTTPPARPFDINRGMTDGYMSASTESSIMPASSHAKTRPSNPRKAKDTRFAEVETSSASDEDIEEARARQLELRAQEHNRLATLRNVVQQWRDTGVKTKEKSQEKIRREMAERAAVDISLGSRFLAEDQDNITESTPEKTITRQTNATQAFILAEKEANDRNIYAPGTFSRIITQVAKRRRAGKDLPPGWSIWASIVPGEDPTSEWFKIKLAADEKAPDLANIVVGPPPNSEVVAAPGILVLQIVPDKWDDNLRRAKELLELLPDDSPYVPGLIIIMIAHPKKADFSSTWITKLDRMLGDIVLDRRGVVITSLESAQAIEDSFFTQVNELRFDVEGLAPRLDLKEFIQEFLNWWDVEFKYGRQQALVPSVDWDIVLLVISVLMSGLDEFLRQVMLQCQVSDIDIPFNNFQSRHNFEHACDEMLNYHTALGGSIERLPVTPAAIAQNPDVLFKLLSRIAKTLQEQVLALHEDLRPRKGLRRPLLEKLASDYNEKLERELLPIDRTSMIYVQRPRDFPPAAPANGLKRKRQPSTTTNGTLVPESPTVLAADEKPIQHKRSRVSLEDAATDGPPSKLSFKVEMAKARLELRVMQSIDLDRMPDETQRNIKKAETIFELALPVLEKVARSDVPADSDVVECRAVLELIRGMEQPLWNLVAQAKALAIFTEKIGRLTGKVGNLEFRELVQTAKHLATRFPY